MPISQPETFLDLYERSCGVSEVPRAYHRWAAFSLLAALVGDRVWVERIQDAPLYPNLYVMLVGPSGLGKNVAIGEAVRLAMTLLGDSVWVGKTTGAALLDLLKRYPRLFLVHAELGNAVRSGTTADELVKALTDYYTPIVGVPVRDATRYHGRVTAPLRCVNWLAGTTHEWLIDSISTASIQAGFGGRIIPVERAYDPAVRIPEPIYPPDRPVLKARLLRRAQALRAATGRFGLTGRAKDLLDDWYMNRPPPSDEALMPAWSRQRELVLKLSMLLALSEHPGNLVVRHPHVGVAIAEAAEVYHGLPSILSMAHLSKDTRPIRLAQQYIQRMGVADHTRLLQYMTGRGYNADALRQALQTLRQADLITMTVRRTPGRNAVSYAWKGERRLTMLHAAPAPPTTELGRAVAGLLRSSGD